MSMSDEHPTEFRISLRGYERPVGRAIRIIQGIVLLTAIALLIADLFLVIPETAPGGISAWGSDTTHAHWPVLGFLLFFVLELFVK